MKTGVAILHDEVPAGVAKIVDARMMPFVRTTLNEGRMCGVMDLRRLALSAYLQGFCDAASKEKR